MRSTVRTLVIAPVLVLAAACSKDKPADPALNNDLGLAAQANSQPRLDSISAAERMNAPVASTTMPVGTAVATPVAPAPTPVRHSTASSTTHHATTHHSTSGSGTRSGSSGSGSSNSGSNTTVAAEPRVETHKNTNRDAAIGAATGAVLGGVVGRGGVKGAVIGGVAGGILGGVIGNNVDVQKKRVP